MAVAFAAAPIAGQNFGAGEHDRVRETFKAAALVGAGIMATLYIVPHRARTWAPHQRSGRAGGDGRYLKITSWNFVAAGLVMMLKPVSGHGRYAPPCWRARCGWSSSSPAIWLSYQPWVALWHIWVLRGLDYGAMDVSVWLLLATFKRKLKPKGT